MKTKLYLSDHLIWQDITNPSTEELKDISSELNILSNSVENCLHPDHLPNVYEIEKGVHIVLRIPDPKPQLVKKRTSDTVQELTTKIVLFVSHQTLFSIHKQNLDLISEVKIKFDALPESQKTMQNLLKIFFENVSHSFEKPLLEIEKSVELFEHQIFHSQRSKALLKEGYYLKRKSSVYKKILKMTLNILPQLPNYKLKKDVFERLHFYSEDIYDNTQGLLNLHLSIASQRVNEASFRTNEIMRVLTILSLFFLPLNFIAGVFGMNFTNMPLLNSEIGFWMSILAMIIIVTAMSLYILKKGWLYRPPS